MMKRLKSRLSSIAIAICLPVIVAADPIVGVWKTEPDRMNLISHIKITACGDKFCGRILSAFDASGKEVQTPNIGKKLFWDVASEGAGKYGGGEFWVPLINVDAVPQMTLQGDKLLVKGCEHAICAHQTWSRL
ncbi:DUF2147 domain-containing protein [Ruegeria sp. HKCCD6119]|uniref:DUF2147 domain-containing protein n=1 Tax=Ruegeria sp. HKCCD6119 TaxID=2683003 RepID=UPI0014924B0A|nr:DUF2147 domain-containing protein [Ruegeria sp. HKCCD6119]NOD82976.1 DUF2147 domain-containing protein [Ruegeria sp. HKCCD6119]